MGVALRNMIETFVNKEFHMAAKFETENISITVFISPL